MLLKIGLIGKYTTTTLKVLKYGMEKISRKDLVKNDEVLQTVKEERNMLHTIKRRKVNWVAHIYRRDFILKWGRKDEEEDVSYYWMTLRKLQDARI
jgi:hypothetical protein